MIKRHVKIIIAFGAEILFSVFFFNYCLTFDGPLKMD